MLERLNPVYPRTTQAKAKPAWFSFVLVLGTLLALLVARDALSIWSYVGSAPAVSCRADTMLVMGAAQYNGVPSPAFQRRLDKALELYKSGCASQIIVTGGKREGDLYTEGVTGVTYLASQGVPESALHSETSSRTSFENIKFSESLARDPELIIVTDDLHAYRSAWLARRLGFQVEVATVGTGADRLAYAFRELMKLFVYQLGMIR